MVVHESALWLICESDLTPCNMISYRGSVFLGCYIGWFMLKRISEAAFDFMYVLWYVGVWVWVCGVCEYGGWCEGEKKSVASYAGYLCILKKIFDF